MEYEEKDFTEDFKLVCESPYQSPVEPPVLRYSRTHFDMIGNRTVKPFLKISIDNSRPFYADEELLKRMLGYLK